MLRGSSIPITCPTTAKYRGLIKKRLFPVLIEGPAPEPGAIVTLDGREAGEMRSSHDGIGLALLRLDAVESCGPLLAGSASLRLLQPSPSEITGSRSEER